MAIYCCRLVSLEKITTVPFSSIVSQPWHTQLRYFATKASQIRARKLEKLGIGPEGKRIPIANPKAIFPRMYKCLVVNQDGSTYHINHHYPHQIITLPLDPATLSQEEREAREKKKRRSKEYQYVSEEDHLDDDWDHTQYKDLLR